jgi:predicted nuclease of restriction endonuclease-like (RecB) superfamily
MTSHPSHTFGEADYVRLLDQIKARIREARVRAALAANAEVILMYWDIGTDILSRQQNEGWGSHVVERLSQDIRHEFPDTKGFSPRNLQYMRAFAEAYPDRTIVQQLVAQLPWGHILHLLHKIKEPEAREWYIRQAVEHGWSRDVLALHTAQSDYERKGNAVTNFSRTLPAPQSDLARDILKDPYIFDFLGLTDDTRERQIENALLQHLREFLIELGNGFAFVGNQYRLDIGDEDYYIDLLFYHLKLRCYFVIDLKTRPFAAEDAGKMNFYLNAVDDLLRHPDDQPSVGLVLCREKEGSNRMLLEYALRGLKKPIGVSEYQLTRALPENLKPSLPTVEEIEREIAGTVADDSESDAGRLVREMREKYGVAPEGGGK